MPDVTVAGTGLTLHFPDTMSRDEIAAAIDTHPAVRQMHYDDFVNRPDPAWNSAIGAYQQKFLADPNDGSIPNQLLQKVQTTPGTYERLDLINKLNPALSEVGKAAILHTAYQNAGDGRNFKEIEARRLAEQHITREQAMSQGIPQAAANAQKQIQDLLDERNNLTQGPLVVGYGGGSLASGAPYQDANSIFGTNKDDAQKRLAANAAALQALGVGAPAVPKYPMPETGAGTINRLGAMAVDRLASGSLHGKSFADSNPSTVGEIVDKVMGQPGTYQTAQNTPTFGARLQTGLLSFMEPESLLTLAEMAPLGAIGGPWGQRAILGAFGVPVAREAYEDAKAGNYGAALGDVGAFAAPLLAHVLPGVGERVINRRFNPGNLPDISPDLSTDPYLRQAHGLAPLTGEPLLDPSSLSVPGAADVRGLPLNTSVPRSLPAKPSDALPASGSAPDLAAHLADIEQVNRARLAGRFQQPGAPPADQPATPPAYLSNGARPLAGTPAAARYDAAYPPGTLPADASASANLPLPLDTSTAAPGSTPDAGTVPTPAATTAPSAVDPAQANQGTAYTAGNTPVPFRYAAVPVGDLVTSHIDQGTGLALNPAYDQTLQPRDRARVASLAQVAALSGNLNPERLGGSPLTSDGAPIVGPDLQVESGNARSLALGRHLSGGDASNYGGWLSQNAARFGLDPADVGRMQAEGRNPVLVRQRTAPVDPEARGALAAEMGRSPVAAFSDVETARGDAQALRSSGALSLFRPQANGEITGAGNTEFNRAFLRAAVPPEEHGAALQADGSLSAAGARRARAALLATAYDDPATLARMLESTDDNVRGVARALTEAAPRLAQLQDGISRGERYPLDIAPDLTEAANKLSHLRERGQRVDDYLAQGSLIAEQDLSDTARDLLRIMEEQKRSPRKLSALISAYIDVADASGDPHNLSMFEDVEPPTKQTTLAAAERLTNGTTADLFASGSADGAEADRSLLSGARPADSTGDAGTAPGEQRNLSPAERKRARLDATNPTDAGATQAGAAPEGSPSAAPNDRLTGRTVSLTVEGQKRTAVLTADQAAEWDRLTATHEDTKANAARNLASGVIDQPTAARLVKGSAMRTAAAQREVSGLLTSKEQLAVYNRSASNFVGKPVIVDGKPGEVIGTGFGRVRVRLDGGEVVNVPPDRVTTPQGEAPPASPPSSLDQRLADVEQAATDHLRKNLGKLNSGIDPQDMAALAALGAVKLARGAIKFSVWSAQMVSDFGEEIRPHLQEIWQAAIAHHDAEIAPGFSLPPISNRLLSTSPQAVTSPTETANHAPETPSSRSFGAERQESNNSSAPRYAASINLDNLNTTEEVRAHIQETAGRMGEQIERARGGRISHAETEQAARDLGLTPAQLQKVAPGSTAAYAVGVRQVLLDTAARHAEAEAAYRDAPTVENLIRFQKATAEYQTTLLSAAGHASEAARTLSAYRIAAEAVRALDKKADPVADVFRPVREAVNPRAREFGSSNKLFTTEEAAAAKERIRQALAGKSGGRLNSGPDPTGGAFDAVDMADLLTVGGHFLEGGLREFGAWASEMREQISDRLTDGQLQTTWANLRTEVAQRVERRQLSTVFVDQLGRRLGREGAANFVNALTDQGRDPAALDALLRGDPTPEQGRAAAQAYIDSQPARTKGAPETGTIGTLDEMVKTARQEIADANKAARPAPSAFEALTRTLTQRLGKAGADAFRASLKDDAGKETLLNRLANGKPISEADRAQIGEAFEANRPARTAATPSEAQQLLSDIVKETRTRQAEEAKAAKEAAQAPPSLKDLALQSLLKDGQADADRIAAKLAKLDPNDIAGISRVMREEAKIPMGHQIVAVIKTGMLSGPRTVAKVVESHSLSLLADLYGMMPTAIVDAWLGSKVTENGRTVMATSPAQLAKATALTLRSLPKETVEIWKHGEEAAVHSGAIKNIGRTSADALFLRSQVKSPILQRYYVDVVSRAHALSYRAFRVFAFEKTIRSAANVYARNEVNGGHITKAEFADRVTFLTENPTESMVADAIDAAERAAYLNENKLTEAMRNFSKDLPPVWQAVMSYLFPFHKVSSNLTARHFQSVPLIGGLTDTEALGGLMRAVGGNKEAMPPELQRRFSVLAGKQTTGLTLLALGAYFAANGWMKGYNGDHEEEGRILIGGRWWEVKGLAPVGNMLTVGASLYEGRKSDDGMLLHGAKAVLQGASENPVSRTAELVSNVSKGEWKGAAGNVAGSVVPQAISDAAAQFDSQKRKKEGVRDYVKERVPGLRETLEGTNTPETNKLFDPMNSRRNK